MLAGSLDSWGHGVSPRSGRPAIDGLVCQFCAKTIGPDWSRPVRAGLSRAPSVMTPALFAPIVQVVKLWNPCSKSRDEPHRVLRRARDVSVAASRCPDLRLMPTRSATHRSSQPAPSSPAQRRRARPRGVRSRRTTGDRDVCPALRRPTGAQSTETSIDRAPCQD